ncbi:MULTISPECIES: [Fe-Fe] hydrogenase large subunit C-terminal domain-containing protein [Clostridia]|uniref:[Fe-Fe] hydrogenase large subunit C-terminal domain-containing protein n=1 Tax=Clostridia TaxID=186801 RepID=UPI000E52EDC5|nr:MULTISPECIES: [Fe-Fe] hydrogenase large subunit C-terminal domain-containing protein [Clostridia]RHV70788.1 4Fe-4S dicluster domain-containing protein [Roseburia sp. OM02-15]
MNKFFHSVYLEDEKCTGCITCLKRCPTQAIRVRNGKAHIISEFCIDCGECIRHCPHHAKHTRRDFLSDLDRFEYTVALPAPSLYSQFNNVRDNDILLTALTLMGFDDVFEVSAGAEIVSELSRTYINEHPELHPLISTACPTIERLIRVRFPGLIPHLLPLLPPMEAAAILARRRAVEKTGLPEDKIGIVFLSPCPSKITFIHEPLGMGKSNIDAVLAIKDIYPVLLSHMKEAEQHPISNTLSGRIGKGWAISGGEAYGIISDHYLAADGIENVIRVLEDLEDEKFLPGLQFVELNACSAGCVGGVLTVENPYIAKAKVKQAFKYEPVLHMHCADLPEFRPEDFLWTQKVSYEPVYTLGANIFESMEKIMESQQILSGLPGLDCGSCGSPTCKALAEDIVKGVDCAKPEDCIYLMREQWEQHSRKKEEEES